MGVHLSESAAGRLALAALGQGAPESAIVEAALEHFLAPDGNIREPKTDHRLTAISQQIERLHHDLRIVNEAVALQTRFLLAVAPKFSPADQLAACHLGVARFEEFVAQVAKRAQLGTSLIKETIERVGTPSPDHPTGESRGGKPRAGSAGPESNDRQATFAENEARREAAKQEGSYQRAANLTTEQISASAIWRQIRSGYRTERSEGTTPKWLLILRVYLPFVAAYYLSFLFRTINATIAGPLISEFGFGADDIGLLSSAYLLTLAAAQIPIGVLLDRHGPRRIQSLLLLAAAVGAALFAVSDNFLLLLVGRALIGLGISAALVTGLKAIVLWFPSDRAPLLNGVMIMLAGLGAVTATLPAEYLLVSVGWRGLFELLAIVSLGCSLVIFLAVPRTQPRSAVRAVKVDLRMVYTNARFWRLAPLSASCVGTAWALQGLWAAQWLSDVEGLDRSELLRKLFLMAIVSSVGALVFGATAQKFRRWGVSSQALLAAVAVLFFLAQFAVILRLPLPSTVPWAIVAAVGTATVLGYTALAEHFPDELTGRANAMLNVVHIGWAFLVQSLIGFVVQRWTPQQGHYPEIAYQVAFTLNLMVQIAAWIWFVICGQKSGA